MSITSEINRIKNNIADAYDALENKGATMPAIENSDNLPSTIESITGGGGLDAIVNQNTDGISPLYVWNGTEEEYSQYEMSSWKNWKTATNVSQSSTVTVPFTLMGMSNFHGVKLLGGKHVVADNYGYIYYSDDGATWVKHKIDANYNDSYLLEYHDGTYYAFTVTSGTIVRYASTDLVNWTSETTDSTQSGGWQDICYVGNRILGWGTGPAMVASDDNGLHWANTTPPDGPYWANNRGISYVNGIGFCSINGGAVDTGVGLWTTTDGTTWTKASASSATITNGSYKIAYGNGIYVMICVYDNSAVASRTSTDGVNWSDVHALGNYRVIGGSDTFDAKSCDITFVNGRFLVSGRYNSSIKYSEDGVTWEEIACETFGKTYGFLPVASNNTAVAYNFNLSSTSPLASPIILVDKKECYTLDSVPTTSSVIYSEPSVESQLTVTSVGTGSITLSDGYTYNRNSDGDVDTYRSVGEVHPDYLSFIDGVGVRIGTTDIADM